MISLKWTTKIQKILKMRKANILIVVTTFSFSIAIFYSALNLNVISNLKYHINI